MDRTVYAFAAGRELTARVRLVPVKWSAAPSSAASKTVAPRSPVPGYLASWEIIDAALPKPLIHFGRRLIGDNRALTDVDHDARGEYERAIRPRSP